MAFDFVKNNQRTWNCFVCGRIYNTFEECRSHIIERHEEGREYIVCPLARCQAPVRDLKLHFKTKHPTEKKIPKYEGNYRAIVWKDFSQKGKKGRVRINKFHSGKYISKKMHGKEMHYKSSWEAEVGKCLEHLSEVESYDFEPIKIPYLFEGETHNYIPDILIRFIDGHMELWEIKPANQTNHPKNKAKWSYAEEFCKAREWKFEVIMEQQIKQLQRKIAERNEYL